MSDEITVKFLPLMTERLGRDEAGRITARYYGCSKGPLCAHVAVSELQAYEYAARGSRSVEEMSEEMARHHAEAMFGQYEEDRAQAERMRTYMESRQ